MKRNRDRLRALMAEYRVTSGQVALMRNRKPQTVRAWMARGGTDIPDDQLKLLEIELKAFVH